MRTVCVAAEPRALWSQKPSAARSCTTGAAPAVPRAARSSGVSPSVHSPSPLVEDGVTALVLSPGMRYASACAAVGLGEYGLHSFSATLVHSSWPPHAA